MSDYYPKKHILPRSVYFQSLWVIRDYYRMRDAVGDVILSVPPRDEGMPSGSGGTGSEVEAKAIKIEQIQARVSAIEAALAEIPIEYRSGVWRNIVFCERFPTDAHRGTYSRWKSKMVYLVAKKLKII